MRRPTVRSLVTPAFIAIAVAAASLAGCPADPGPSSSGTPRPPQALAMHIALRGSTARVVSLTAMATMDAPPDNQVSGPRLTYTFTSAAGAVLATGAVADPRVVYGEWFENGAAQRYDGLQNNASIVLVLPARRGTLEIDEDHGQGPTPLAHFDVVPPAHSLPPGTAASNLVSARTSVVGTPVKVVDHGSAHDAFDLVFLPEGYTADQLATFATDVDRVVAQLAERPDYARHWNQINVWRIDVASADSGVSDAAPATPKDTAFALRRDATLDRLFIFGDTDGMAAATELGARVDADSVFIIANSGYGGSGGRIATASNASELANIVAHELGHSMFHLADEYFDATNPERTDAECAAAAPGGPNASVAADLASLPWGDLVASGTMLPTPDTTDTLGAYLGGDRCRSSRYRPTHHCVMGPDLHQAFCPVCQREMDRYFARFPSSGGGSTGGGTGADAGMTSGSDAGSGPASPSCQYTCSSLGYVAGQCVSGWYCDGSCVTQNGCMPSDPPPPSDDAGVGGDDAGASGGLDGGVSSGTGSCDYTCDSLGYATGECVMGWYCDGTCVTNNGCTASDGTTDVDAGSGGGSTDPSCEYTCDSLGYANGQCVSGWFCDGTCVTYTGCE